MTTRRDWTAGRGVQPEVTQVVDSQTENKQKLRYNSRNAMECERKNLWII
jgi:hypothetical protein